MRTKNALCALFVGAMLLLGNLPIRAERIVLAPYASTLPSYGYRLETMVSPYRRNENFSWVQISTPQSIELEYNRWDLLGDSRLRDSLNIQYPLFTDLGSIPAISLGVRDILGTGIERQSLYLVAGKSIFLSDRQLKLWKEIKLSAGAGTGRFEGVFLGISTRLRNGISLDAELYRYRPNFSVGVPVIKHLEASAHSLNGQVYYGLTFRVAN